MTRPPTGPVTPDETSSHATTAAKTSAAASRERSQTEIIVSPTDLGRDAPPADSAYARRIWLESYPAGIPAEIDVGAFRSLCHVFDDSVRKFGPLPAYVNMGTGITYDELDRQSRRLGSCLTNVAGLRRGARVALMMPNLLQYPIALFGILRAGLTVVNCNPLYTPRELEYQLNDSGAEAIIVLETLAHVAEQAIGRTRVKHVITTSVGDCLALPKRILVDFMVRHVKKLVKPWSIPDAVPFRSALMRGAEIPFVPVDCNPEDVAFLQYTGGTTGVPKGAMLTHRNMVANLQQAHAWLKSFLEEGCETVVTALPLYHVFALTANCLVFLKIGAKNLLITDPRDVRGFVKVLRKNRFSVITGVNTLFNALLNHPDFSGVDFSHVKFCLGGGMSVQQSVAERWRRLTQRPLLEGYGLTEASPIVTIVPLTVTEYTGSIGLPVPSTDVAILDDDGRDVPLGDSGELCVRGPQVMKGYWNRPDETGAVMTASGFLRTGDVARMDQKGFLYIVDRKKDMINVSGFKVFPNEVEGVVMLHPGVVEAGAIGVPDEQSGEAVKIVVVKRDPQLTADALIGHCRQHLTRYKVPKHVEFRSELPKSSIGKILRRALRE